MNALLTGKLVASKRATREFPSVVLGVELRVESVSKKEAIIVGVLVALLFLGQGESR